MHRRTKEEILDSDEGRKIADANGIPYTRKEGIDSLNQALTKAGVYTAIVKKHIEVWK